MHTSPTPTHLVICPYRTQEFNLFAASWCWDTEEPLKICPHCEPCLCQHLAYGEPHFWKPAPVAFQRHGFQRPFLFYV